MDLRRDDGSATVLVVSAAFLVVAAALVACTFAGVLAARHRAGGVADLAALAAAAAAVRGADPCAAAGRVAAAQSARLVGCGVEALEVDVRVAVAARFWRLGPRLVEGRARAGPATPAP